MSIFETMSKGEDYIVTKVKDNINSETIEEFEKTIKEFVDNGFKRIVIDLQDVEFISSQGLGILVINYKPVAEKGGFIALMNLNESIRRVMEITRLDKVLKIADSLEELDIE
ncbi:MAG: STAS domain-containing protein [Candidatus Muiribacteriaceae bacterium]